MRYTHLWTRGLNTMDRDCDNCVRCGRNGCTAWGCEYINRKEAIEAWKEKYGKGDEQNG